MNRWTSAGSLLAATVLLTACTATALPNEKSLQDVQSSTADGTALLGQSLIPATNAMTCSIGSATPTPEGVRLSFRKNMFWNFVVDLAGREGLIGSGGVVEFVNRPNGHQDVLPTVPYLDIKFDQELRLSDHHARCAVGATREQGRVILRTQSSFCMTSMPCTHSETAHEL